MSVEFGKIELLIGDVIQTNFDNLSISVSTDNIAIGFGFSFSGKDPGIKTQEVAKIKYNGNVIVAGYVELKDRSYDNSGIKCIYSCRSYTGQLVGPSIIGKNEYKNKKADFIIRDIVKPFGIDVVINADVGSALKKFSIEPSEDPLSAISRLLKLRKLLAYDDGERLVIIKSSDIIVGSVITDKRFTISESEDVSNLYSEYKVIGNDKNVSSSVKNDIITNYRPKVIIADTEVNKKSAQNMAEWEKQKAVGEYITNTVNGVGWADDNGEIFKINSLCPVEFKVLNIVKNVLIKSINFSYSSSGEKISMVFVDKDTYS